jgi:phosphoglucosamine mutase
MISASHNPWTDNGIKFFDTNGEKLADAVEEEIEAIWQDPGETRGAEAVGTEATDVRLPAEYREAVVHEFVGRVGSGKVAIDCANGAVSVWAPQIFRALGYEPVVHHASPDGRNINADCGAMHPERLAAVIAADLKGSPGFAFDGDADRVIAIDETGTVVDGDAVLAVIGLHLAEKGELAGKRIVATVMSNLGLERALAAKNVVLERSAVGDRYVYEMMRETKAVLGGEQSGHILLTNNGSTTGDGIRTALMLLAIMHETGKPLSELASVYTASPQKLLNVALKEKPPLPSVAGLAEIQRAIESEHGKNVRVVLRYSGTEPKLRIMVEGPDDATCASLCDRLAAPFAAWRA